MPKTTRTLFIAFIATNGIALTILATWYLLKGGEEPLVGISALVVGLTTTIGTTLR